MKLIGVKDLSRLMSIVSIVQRSIVPPLEEEFEGLWKCQPWIIHLATAAVAQLNFT